MDRHTGVGERPEQGFLNPGEIRLGGLTPTSTDTVGGRKTTPLSRSSRETAKGGRRLSSLPPTVWVSGKDDLTVTFLLGPPSLRPEEQWFVSP